MHVHRFTPNGKPQVVWFDLRDRTHNFIATPSERMRISKLAITMGVALTESILCTNDIYQIAKRPAIYSSGLHHLQYSLQPIAPRRVDRGCCPLFEMRR